MKLNRIKSVLEERGISQTNGKQSNPTKICSSLNDAIHQFKNYNRRNMLQNLRFSKVSTINECVKYIIPEEEPFRVKLSMYGADFDEMRRIRNHIAHGNDNTYKEYKQVIICRYGAYIRQNPGTFLISTSRNHRPKIEEYRIKTKVIISDITGG